MEEEKEYLLHFYDGRVRRVTGKLSELQRLNVSKIEEAPPTLAPFSIVRRDMERINRALGEGFKLFQEVMTPQDILDRIEALHPDQAPLRLPQALRDLMNLPRKMWERKPPPPDGFFRRY